MTFGEIIIHWYHHNKRDLPWRHTKDPYKIWLSEIILQQTRVEQGLAYYHRFAKKYPDVRKLASAKEDEVLKLWQGLGYYSRARNLHHAAKEIVALYKGKFPGRYSEIRSLKGIGDYTAAAIASFAYNLPYPVVDGNVFRLLSRYLGIGTPINSSKAKKEFYEAARELMFEEIKQSERLIAGKKKVGTFSISDFNQAMMEFGSKQCKAQNPNCRECPLNQSCWAFAKKRVDELPVKKKKEKVKNRYFYYAVMNDGNRLFLKKRMANDIWKNLYDFPMIETTKKISSEKLYEYKEWKDLIGKKTSGQKVLKESKTFLHKLSHQTIFAKFIELKIAPSINIKGAKKVRHSHIHQYAVPKLIENYLATNLLK